MKISSLLFAVVAIPNLLLATPQHGDKEFGVYEDLGLVPNLELQDACTTFVDALKKEDGVELLSWREIASPDLVREDEEDRDGRKGMFVCFRDLELSQALFALNPKYLVSSIQRVGFYQEPNGLRMSMLQPETFVRIACNDLPEDSPKYEAIAEVAGRTAARIRILAREVLAVQANGQHMPPIRDTEDIREADKDMFMMVGKLTYFVDTDQFPIIWSKPVGENAIVDLKETTSWVLNNIANFTADEDDAEYEWCPNPEQDLKWTTEFQVNFEDRAVLLGISRPRTEALAMHIAGKSRSDDGHLSPGLDHLCSFPIEVLISIEDDKVLIRTAREMFRMDQFFWDAGKMAFMSYKGMPGMLDESISRALLGTELGL